MGLCQQEMEAVMYITFIDSIREFEDALCTATYTVKKAAREGISLVHSTTGKQSTSLSLSLFSFLFLLPPFYISRLYSYKGAQRVAQHIPASQIFQ